MYDGVKWVPMLFSANENLIPPITRQATDGLPSDGLGYNVSISGDYAIAGLSPGANSIGAAYIFFRNGGVWQQQAKLTPADGTSNDDFGTNVSISGNYAIVGARNSNGGNGKAYIFMRNGAAWTEQAKLTASDGNAGDFFGFSVSINGDYAIVGAPNDVVGVNNAQGSAYIFYRGAGWTTGQAYQAKLLAPDGAAEDLFGRSVSISGDYAIVGAPANDAENLDQGAAYVYGRVGANWPTLAKLKGLLSPNRWFGSSVCINGDSC